MNFWVSVINRYLWYRDLGICDHLACLRKLGLEVCVGVCVCVWGGGVLSKSCG